MKVIYNNQEFNCPDFLIVGAAKSGTTSLHYYLKVHKEVFMPEDKEPYFFSFWNEDPQFVSPDNLPEAVSDLEVYSSIFKNAQEGKLLGDASPSYLYTFEKSIRNIKEIYGEQSNKLQIIIILREPVSRAWSQYMHFRKYDKEPLEYLSAFSDATISERMQGNWNIFYDYVGFSKYAKAVAAYKENFPSVKVFLFDELKNDTEGVVNSICRFLHLEEFGDLAHVEKQHNVSGQPEGAISKAIWSIMYKKNPLKSIAAKVVPSGLKKKIFSYTSPKILVKNEMPQDLIQFIGPHFRDDLSELSGLVDQDISNWRSNG